MNGYCFLLNILWLASYGISPLQDNVGSSRHFTFTTCRENAKYIYNTRSPPEGSWITPLCESGSCWFAVTHSFYLFLLEATQKITITFNH